MICPGEYIPLVGLSTSLLYVKFTAFHLMNSPRIWLNDVSPFDDVSGYVFLNLPLPSLSKAFFQVGSALELGS